MVSHLLLPQLVGWPAKSLQIYWGETARLKQAATPLVADILTSPLLPGFRLPVGRLF
jgi:hypothetical protein